MNRRISFKDDVLSLINGTSENNFLLYYRIRFENINRLSFDKIKITVDKNKTLKVDILSKDDVNVNIHLTSYKETLEFLEPRHVVYDLRTYKGRKQFALKYFKNCFKCPLLFKTDTPRTYMPFNDTYLWKIETEYQSIAFRHRVRTYLDLVNKCKYVNRLYIELYCIWQFHRVFFSKYTPEDFNLQNFYTLITKLKLTHNDIVNKDTFINMTPHELQRIVNKQELGSYPLEFKELLPF